MLSVFFRSEPWAVPAAILVAMISAVAAPAISRRTGGHGFGWWLYLTAIGGYAAVTVTPRGGHFSPGLSRHIIRSMSPALPTAHDLHSLNEVSLNVAAGIPLGFACVVLAYQLGNGWPYVAIVLPFVAEVMQGVLPGLNRVGFLMGDATVNMTGVVLGLGLGAAVLAASGASPGRRRSSGREKQSDVQHVSTPTR